MTKQLTHMQRLNIALRWQKATYDNAQKKRSRLLWEALIVAIQFFPLVLWRFFVFSVFPIYWFCFEPLKAAFNSDVTDEQLIKLKTTLDEHTVNVASVPASNEVN